jgi:hypothetical protein
VLLAVAGARSKRNSGHMPTARTSTTPNGSTHPRDHARSARRRRPAGHRVVRDVGTQATDAPARREVDARIAAVEERLAEPAMLEVKQPDAVADSVAVVGTRVTAKQHVDVVRGELWRVRSIISSKNVRGGSIARRPNVSTIAASSCASTLPTGSSKSEMCRAARLPMRETVQMPPLRAKVELERMRDGEIIGASISALQDGFIHQRLIDNSAA